MSDIGSYVGQDSGYVMLACEIVGRAVLDWRMMISGTYPPKSSFDEIRRFFRGRWCGTLVGGSDFTPTEMLKILEAELENGMVSDGIWTSMKEDYLRGMTYRQLESKYGIDASTICKRGKKERWRKQRTEAMA